MMRKEPCQKAEKQKSNVLNHIAIVLIILSFVLYGFIFLVPFFHFTLVQKTAIISVLVAVGEITWWVSIAIVGKQAVTKYRKYLNPCHWFCCNKEKQIIK